MKPDFRIIDTHFLILVIAVFSFCLSSTQLQGIDTIDNIEACRAAAIALADHSSTVTADSMKQADRALGQQLAIWVNQLHQQRRISTQSPALRDQWRVTSVSSLGDQFHTEFAFDQLPQVRDSGDMKSGARRLSTGLKRLNGKTPHKKYGVAKIYEGKDDIAYFLTLLQSHAKSTDLPPQEAVRVVRPSLRDLVGQFRYHILRQRAYELRPEHSLIARIEQIHQVLNRKQNAGRDPYIYYSAMGPKDLHFDILYRREGGKPQLVVTLWSRKPILESDTNRPKQVLAEIQAKYFTEEPHTDSTPVSPPLASATLASDALPPKPAEPSWNPVGKQGLTEVKRSGQFLLLDTTPHQVAWNKSTDRWFTFENGSWTLNPPQAEADNVLHSLLKPFAD